MSTLSINDLRVEVATESGPKEILKGVNLTVNDGEVHAIMGPNGSGKSTILRLILGDHLQGYANDILLFGRPKGSGETLWEIKKRIGYMSQKFSLYNDLRVAENLDFYAAIYGISQASERKKRVDELLEIAGIKDFRRELTKNLSGAWRQRVALSCAIIHDPKMLFLDEATAGVDPLARRSFWDLIYQLAGRGISVLATTHYMDEADYCNIIAMMYQGKIVALAGPDEIKEQQPGVLIHIETDKPVEAQEFLTEDNTVINSSVQGVQLHVTVPDEQAIPNLRARLDQAGFAVHALEVIQPSLEDAFTAIVQREREGS